MISHTRQHERGNALFLILIAVALFAALSYAVTSSTSGGGSDISAEKASTNAAAIIQFMTTLRNAAIKVKIINGCGDDQLDFSNKIYMKNNGSAIDSANSNAPANKKCHLFDPAGGSVVPFVPAPGAVDSTIGTGPTNFKSGHGGIFVGQIKGVGSDDVAGTVTANDIVFRLSQLNKITCVEINKLLDVENPGGDPPDSTGVTGLAGAYTNGSLAATYILDNAAINGHNGFCHGTLAGGYVYREAIVAR